MKEQSDIRWKQRFSNLTKAFNSLTDAVNKKELTPLEKSGLIQTFEFTFELAWKTLKDYLESQLVMAPFPRDIIKEAFKYELISDGEMWLDMLDKRNLMSHTYDEEKADLACQLISGKYYKHIMQLLNMLNSKL